MFDSQMLYIDSGREGTRQTLSLMRKAVLEGTKDPVIVMVARTLVAGVKEKDQWQESLALFKFVSENIRYVKDIYNRETILYPRSTLQIGSGDCDDKTVLFAALAHTIGIPSAFVAIRLPGRDIFSHVYPELLINGQWLPYELTVRGATPGVAPAKAAEIIREEVIKEENDKMYWNVVANSIKNPVAGLGGWYEELYGGMISWSDKLKNIAQMLKEAPKYTEYAQQGKQIASTEAAIKDWLKQPFTLVVLGMMALLIYKQRKRKVT